MWRNPPHKQNPQQSQGKMQKPGSVLKREFRLVTLGFGSKIRPEQHKIGVCEGYRGTNFVNGEPKEVAGNNCVRRIF